MDLYRIDSSLRKGYSDRSSHFSRTDATSSGIHHNELSKQFANNDILSSSSWSAVIHQPAQDSEPEDLPSTVDIDAIKEPPTPINASAQTPARQFHGDNRFALSDDQNAGESGSDSDSDSESGNTENENAGSGIDSDSSDSESVSSHPSSSSSKGKPPSSRSSRSNSPPSVYDDQEQQFSVRETNFEQGGLKLKLSALKVSRQNSESYSDRYRTDDNGDNSSDSSEPRLSAERKRYRFDKTKQRNLYPLKTKNDYKNKVSPYRGGAYSTKEKSKCIGYVYGKDSDSESSSSSNTSPIKMYVPRKKFINPKLASKFENSSSGSSSRSKFGSAFESRNYFSSKENKNSEQRVASHFASKRNEMKNASQNVVKEKTLPSPVNNHSKYRMNRSFGTSALKLPQSCKLSEDSDDSSYENTKTKARSDPKKENNRDTIEKLAQQLTQPNSGQLQVLNQEDLAAVLPDVEGTADGGEYELTDCSSGKRKTNAVVESKKAISSESSSDTELFPKQEQIVRDVINSIHVDSDDESNRSDDSSKSSDENTSSEDERVKSKPQIRKNFSQQSTPNKTASKTKSKNSSAPVPEQKKDTEVVRKRGRPPKAKMSSMAEIEAYMRLDCTVSNVSPDSGIQSNAGSPLYHGLQSSVSFNQNSHSAVGGNKLHTSSSSARPLSLSQKVVLSASKKKAINQRQSLNKLPADTQHEILKKPSSLLSSTKSDLAGKKLDASKQANRTKAEEALKPMYAKTKLPHQPSSVSHSGNLALFQNKRGPGRPKKITTTPPSAAPVIRDSEKAKLEKVTPPGIQESRFEKSYDRSTQKPPVLTPNLKAKTEKTLYRGPMIMWSENKKKSKEKKNLVLPAAHHSFVKMKPATSFASLYPARKEWTRKHKKRKKKDSKEKNVSVEFLKSMEGLVEVFNKKCLIEDKKSALENNQQFLHSVVMRSKLAFKAKDKNLKKKKYPEKGKHSDKDSEPESTSCTPAAPSVMNGKRRHKKSAIETPKVLETNSDQRLPLKKRHYHVSASSTTSNSNQQTHNETKNRPDTHKSVPKTDAVKTTTKNEIQKNVIKTDVRKVSTKPEAQKVSRMETSTTPKPDEIKNDESSSVKKCAPVENGKKMDSAVPKKEKTDAMESASIAARETSQPNADKETSNESLVVKSEFSSAVPAVSANKHVITNKPQLITPLPAEPEIANTTENMKPPAGVFEPSRKLPSSISKFKKNSIADVLSKLTEKLKVLDSPLKNASALIEKICDSKAEADQQESSGGRVLRPKRSGAEKETAVPAKKSKVCKEMSIRLRKLSNSEINNNGRTMLDGNNGKGGGGGDDDNDTVSSSNSEAVSDLKRKLKRRKSINRTGFPVKKKKKRTKLSLDSASPYDTNVDSPAAINVIEQTKTDENCKTETNNVLLNLKNEIVEEQTNATTRTTSTKGKSVTSPAADSSVVKVKSEIMSEDETVNVKKGKRDVKSQNKKVQKQPEIPSHLLPTRCSTRIHIKKQLRAKETKKMMRKKSHKGGALAAKAAVPENVNKQLRARECKTKNNANEKDDVVKNEKSFNKENKSRSQISKEEATTKEKTNESVNGKQLRVRECKTKNAEKEVKVKPDQGKNETAKEMPDIGKPLRMRECRLKNMKAETEKEIAPKNNEKEGKSKEETDKDELSDTDSAIQKKEDIPKWKRKYIPAGLFSDYYKEEKHAVFDAKSRFNYKEEDHPHGLLPPPPYFEDWVRHRRVDFKLPYDLWWLHTHNQLPGRDNVIHSWNYKKIRTNVYYDVKPTYMYEAQACNCKMPTEKDKLGCGEDCINRMVYAECSPQLCPLKQKCSNQKIQKHDWASKLVKFMTTDKGWGVKTKEHIRCGDFILEYVGEVVTDKEFKKRMTSLYTTDIHHYCLNLDGGLLIDGHRMGGFGRFVNHSCEPNCEMQKWSVNGLFRMALFALRDIRAGEELSYDYNFALFNPAEGQPCKCGSSNCRGVIGGKSQRLTNGVPSTVTAADVASTSASSSSNATTDKKNDLRSRSRKQIRKPINALNQESITQRRDSTASSNSMGIMPHRNVYTLMPVKPLTLDEKKIVFAHRMFLIRNLNKIQRFKEKLIQMCNKENANNAKQSGASKMDDSAAKESAVFLTQLNALSTQRFIRTRRLAQAQDNPEVTKTALLANVFRTIFSDVICAKDENGEPFSSLFMTLPSKRKVPMYYQRIGEPIDLNTIEKNIVSGIYKNVELFDKDMNRLIMNNVKYYGRTSDYGIAAVRLRKEYNIAKLNYSGQLVEIIGNPLPASFTPEQEDPGDEDEDVIRCICGLFNDEGLMIQCERCLVWQHCDCVKADTNAEHYLCERCNPRDVEYEIVLDDVPDYANPGEKHYLTLMRDDLQIRQGDTVYVLRDILNPETNARHTFKTIKNFKFSDCDIFRVERLWKTESGENMSFGHHYLRPHETFHEPTRRFFPNEVVKVPLYETVPLDLIMGQCYVLDLATYRKGRPIDSDPQHMYICEFRVDKAARLFYKLPKSKQPTVCTKNYAFEKYDTALKPARTYAPHGEAKLSATPSGTATASKAAVVPNQKIKSSKVEENVSGNSENNRLANDGVLEKSLNNPKLDEDDIPLALMKDYKVEKQKQRLNSILLKLLAKRSTTKAPLDASYLLDLGRRNRKKTTSQANNNNNNSNA